jgi:hypothetical protein
MDKYIDGAYEVTTQLFGPSSGIPWWTWIFVLVALFWKVIMPERKTARQMAEERDTAMLNDIFGYGKDEMKKGKKSKK